MDFMPTEGFSLRSAASPADNHDQIEISMQRLAWEIGPGFAAQMGNLVN